MHQVPGFTDADVFWRSELGRALHTPTVIRVGGLPRLELEDPISTGADDRLLETTDFVELLDQAKADAVLSTFDVWLMIQVHIGDKLVDLAREPQALAAMRELGRDLDEHVEQLRAALLRWSRFRLGDDSDEDDAA